MNETKNSDPQNQGPLRGVRVIDLTRIIVGPFCTLQLADLGAEVIKIERPGHGDDTRHMKPPAQGGEAHFYLAFNRNKKSVAIDLKAKEGRALINNLLKEAHVVIENFRPGVTKRLGLDYDSIKDRHPHLIYCSISSYGQTGMMSHRPGLDPVLQAEMGLMSLNGVPDGEPMRHPLSLTDLYTGLYASTAISAAIVAQRDSRQGQHIDLSLMKGALGALGNMAQYYFASGENPPRLGNGFPTASPVGAFRGSDGGMFYLACGTDKLFNTLATKALDRPDLLEDERYNTNSARVQNRDSLMALLTDAFATDTRDNWVAHIQKAGAPAGPVRGISEALESPEVAEAGMVTTVDHPTAGELRMMASPLKLSGTPTATPVAPPLLGQHTDEVLTELLNLDAAALAALRESNIIG